MNNLLIGLLGAVLATNQPLATSNLIQQQTGVSVPVVDANDPVEKELQQLMIADDAALDEVDLWIRTNNAAIEAGKEGAPKDELNTRIKTRLDGIKQDYQNFLGRHPNHARGYLAYGSFLNDIGDEEGAKFQFENSLKIDPANPAVWNNLANYYGHEGPITNAFVYYTKAIELNPAEPVYYQNLGTTVYLYRKDAREFYGINEQQVFDKALELYGKALKLRPDNFDLATDLAQSYYGIKPLRTNDALNAWTNALKIAHDDTEREGVYIHLARIKIAAGRFDEARAQLADVTNSMYAGLRTRVERSLADREFAATNPAPPMTTNTIANTPKPAPVASTNIVNLTTNLIFSTPTLRPLPTTNDTNTP